MSLLSVGLAFGQLKNDWILGIIPTGQGDRKRLLPSADLAGRAVPPLAVAVCPAPKHHPEGRFYSLLKGWFQGLSQEARSAV